MKIRNWRTGEGFLRGIDVSHYQGSINFAKVKQNGIKFAILRSYGSATSEDKRMVEYASGFRNVGIPCGSYFFCTISNEYDLDTARTQANKYANKLEQVFGSKNWGDLLPFLDLEGNENVGGRHSSLNTTAMLSWVNEFRKTFEQRFDNKVKLGLYTNWGFVREHNNFNEGVTTSGNILKDMPFWVAKWRTTSIPDIGGWKNWVAWQYTDNAYPFSSGQSVGVSSTGLDMNYTESLDDLRAISSIDASTPIAKLTESNTIQITWNKPTVNNVTKIELHRNGSLIALLSKNSSSYHDINIEYGRTYSYEIVVFRGEESQKSKPSAGIKTIIPPSQAPVGLKGEAKDKEIILTWNPNPVSEGTVTYQVFMDDKKVGATTNTSYSVKGLENGKIYTFNIQAYNEANPKFSEKSQPIEIAPITKYPIPPSLIRTFVEPTGNILVKWTYSPDEDFDHFYLVVNGKYVGETTVENQYVLKNVEVNVRHDIRVVAVDKDGDRTLSRTLTTAVYEPPQVTGLKGTAYDRKVKLEWDKPDFFYPSQLPPQPPEPRPQPASANFYIVQAGDTMQKIAIEHDMNEMDLYGWNPHLINESMVEGETLFIDNNIPQGTRIYYIFNNDTFHSIAEKFEMTQEELLAYNPEIDPANLIVGSKIIVKDPTQPPVITTIEYRTETRTRTVSTKVQEEVQVAKTREVIDYKVVSENELKENALSLTALLETSQGYPDAYGRTAGNFDGQGMSFGAIQFNFGQGTLQPILKTMFNSHADVLRSILPTYYYNTLRNVTFNMTKYQQINWGNNISTSGKSNIIEPWRTYFYQIGTSQECINLQVKQAESFFKQGKNYFNHFSLKTRRGFALMFDIAVQSWSISAGTVNLILNDFKKINTNGKTLGQIETEKMVIIANRKANEVSSQWRDTYRNRKLSIANGTGTVYGSLYVDTNVYNLTLEPAFSKDAEPFKRLETYYETVLVDKVAEVEEQYEVQVPVITAYQIEEKDEFTDVYIPSPEPTMTRSFFIFQNDELVKVLDGDFNTLELDNLENGKDYKYEVQIVSTQDLKGSKSNPIALSPVIEYPNKAYDLNYEILDKTTIHFSWKIVEKENFSHFKVLVNDKVLAEETDVTYIIYEGATPNHDYTLEIITYDFDGDSVTSGILTARINVPQIPTNLQTKERDREVIFSWDLSEENFVKKYNVYLNEELYAVVDYPSNSLVVQGLENNVSYSLQVQAEGENTFTSEISDPVYGVPIIDIPNIPKFTSHRELGNSGVELRWEHEKKEGHSHYNLYLNGFLYAERITENSYQTDTLERNITHTFQVEAFDVQGDRSGFSDSEYVTIYSKILEPLSVSLGKVDEEMETIKPELYLCSPIKKTIGKLSEAYGIAYNTRYADLNEITFNIPSHIDFNGKLLENKHYSKLKERFLIRIEYGNQIEYFIINQITNTSDNNSKQIHAWSLGYELKDKLITNYNEEIYTAHSAILFALDESVNWKIGANIKNDDFYWNRERRIFTVSNQTVLDFIIQVAESFNAVLEWDTVNRIVDFKNPFIQDENRGLKIKEGKYLKNLTKTSSIEEMVTHLKPIGENNLTIASATSNGAEYLEDFSYFLKGFNVENLDFADFYLKSKAIVNNPNDDYYTEIMEYNDVPKGAIFTEINLTNNELSNEVHIGTVAKSIINMIKMYNITNGNAYIERAKLFGDFLVEQKIDAYFMDNFFNILPERITYDEITATWNSDYSEVKIETLYQVTHALLELYDAFAKETYSELYENILTFLSFLHNYNNEHITEGTVSVGYEGLIYQKIKFHQVNEGNNLFTIDLNTFDNSALLPLANTWKKYIEVHGNIKKQDIFGTIYFPEEIFNVTLDFFNKEYNSGRILMSPTNLPYSYYHKAEGSTVPIPANYDSVTGTFGDNYFALNSILKIALGYYEIGLGGISLNLRENIFGLKDDTGYTNNELVFFELYSFEGIGGVGENINKPLANTGLFMQLENELNQLENIELLKQTIYKYQVLNENDITNRGFIENVNILNGNIHNQTLVEVVNPMATIENLKILSSSPYMSDELCMAILSYKKLLASKDGEFLELIEKRKEKYEEMNDLEYELSLREEELFATQQLLDTLRPEDDFYFTFVNYVGQARVVDYILKKDRRYALFGKTNNNNGITINTHLGDVTFSKTDEWVLLEKIYFERIDEDTVEASKRDYELNLRVLGEGKADIELQITSIVQEDFENEDNEQELINKFIEEISQNKYDEQETLITEKENEIQLVTNDIVTLQSELSIYNNFSPELIRERDLFVITKEYIDEMIANPEELKNRAIEKFEELKNPVITIEIDIVNLREILEEHYNWHKLELGTIVNVLYDKFDVMIQAKIIEMTFDFDNKSITLTISNIQDIKTNQEKFIDAIYGAVSTSTTVSLEKHSWSKATQVKEDFDSFMNQAFDATKQKIIAGTNETVEISRRGLLIKSDTDPNSFLVANSSVLAITNDGGKSYKNAITTFGVVAERLFGQIIAGENLIIENQAGNFRVDSEGVTIENQALKIIGGISQEQLSDDVSFKGDLSGISKTYEDEYAENNQNGVIPLSPTITEDGTEIQFTSVTEELVNISFNWEYSEEETENTDIDGFMVYIYTSHSSAPYTFGSRSSAEITYHVKENKRSIILYNVPKNLYYNFGVEAYRVVDVEVDINGVIKSPVIQPSLPFNPVNETAYDGNIIGTVDYNNVVKIKDDTITVIRQGQSYSNVTIDSNNGLVAENNYGNQKIIINDEGFRIQKNEGTGYYDVLYADNSGDLVAEDLIANRLVINDGSGEELINARTKQINFDKFDVVTGDIHADNIDLKGLQVLDTNGITTFGIDNAGNVTIAGNITMLGGSITWGSVPAPSYTQIQGVKPPEDATNTKKDLTENTTEFQGFKNVNGVVKPSPNYNDIEGIEGIDKPTVDANNTLHELLNNTSLQGLFYREGNVYINATGIKTGVLDANLITVKNLDASSITSGTIDASFIDTDISQVNEYVYIGSGDTQGTIILNSNGTKDVAIKGSTFVGEPRMMLQAGVVEISDCTLDLGSTNISYYNTEVDGVSVPLSHYGSPSNDHISLQYKTVSIRMNHTTLNSIIVSYPAYSQRLPLWVVAMPKNSNSSSIHASVYNIGQYNCEVYIQHIHNTDYGDYYIEVQVIVASYL